MTQGRASYAMEFSNYERVPNNIATQIMDERKGKTKNTEDE
jgi:elongation factor G